MYRNGAGQVFAIGHAAAAVAAPSASWFFGEGATGAFFDTFLLLANPLSETRWSRSTTCATAPAAVTRTYIVLQEGVTEGRKVFANITKYIKMGASSNFGNMFSVLGASIFCPSCQWRRYRC